MTIQDRTNRFPILAGLFAAVLFGAATPASKALLATVTPFQLAGLLYLGSAIGVIPLLLKEKRLVMPWRLPRSTRLNLLGAIIFGGLLGPILLLLGLRMASSASVSLWLNLELVATALLGHLFFRDQITRISAIAAAGTLIAAMMISVSEGAAGFQAGLLILLACASWGMDNHFTAIIDGITPAQTTFWKGLAAGPVNFCIGLIIGGYTASLTTAALGFGVGVFAYGISIVLYITSAQQLGATRSQIIFSSSPFFGVLFSCVWLGESITLLQSLAMLLITSSLLILILERHAHSHSHIARTHEHWHRHDDGHHETHHDPAGLTAEQAPKGWHSHRHNHKSTVHSHVHWPDLHHRHFHEKPPSDHK